MASHTYSKEANNKAKNKWRNKNYQYATVFPIELKEYIQGRGKEFGGVSKYLLALVMADKERSDSNG